MAVRSCFKIKIQFLFLLIWIQIPNLFCQTILSPQKFNLQKFDTIKERFNPPDGFKRLKIDSSSFSAWLRNLPLLPKGEPAKDYRGRIKVRSTDTTLAAVAAVKIAGRKLDQCMDILIRFRAEYLWMTNRKDEIYFPLPDGFILAWKSWRQGQRPHFAGLHFFLKPAAGIDSSKANFEKYLRTLFEYSSTQTFYYYYESVDPLQLQIGDFVVKKGKRGHAVMIIDLAEDGNGKRIALIGQGDTPACRFYLLNYKKDNPWFPVEPSVKKLPLPIKKIMTWNGLRRFP